MNFKSAQIKHVVLAFTVILANQALAQNIATVNGKAISSAEQDAMIQQITAQANGPKDTSALREKVKQELITRELLNQEAEKMGMDKSKEFKMQLGNARETIMIRALARDYVKKNPATPAEIQAEYDKRVKLAGDKEYHVRHILVSSEDQAKEMISRLKAGASFDELAKQSLDKNSANNGGDLNWVTPNRFDKSFSDVMVNLQKGQMTEVPVHTRYGYHIIQVVDKRALTIPPLDDKLKAQISQSVEQTKLEQYRNNLRSQAVIK